MNKHTLQIQLIRLIGRDIDNAKANKDKRKAKKLEKVLDNVVDYLRECKC